MGTLIVAELYVHDLFSIYCAIVALLKRRYP